MITIIVTVMAVYYLGRLWWRARYRLFARSRQDIWSGQWWSVWHAETYRQWGCCQQQWQWFFLW